MIMTDSKPKTLTAFQKLVDAEDYLQFFEIEYDRHTDGPGTYEMDVGRSAKRQVSPLSERQPHGDVR